MVVASKEIGLEVNTDKTKYTVMPRDQNSGLRHSIKRLRHSTKIDNSSFERVEEFKYLGTTLTNQNCIQEGIKGRLKSGNACHHLVQNLWSCQLLSKNKQIKTDRTIILPVVLYGCETWPFTLREECRLRVFENRVLRRIFGPKRETVTGEWRKPNNEKINDLYCSPNIVQVIKSRKIRWVGHVSRNGERKGVHRVLVGKPEGKNHLEDSGIDETVILKSIFRKLGVGGTDWIYLAQDRDRQRAFVNAVTNLRVP